MKDARDKAEELKGKAKEKIGDWTDNESMQAEGMAEQAKAKAKMTADDVKDKVKDKAGELKDKTSDAMRR